MVIKLIGGALIFLSASLFGFRYSLDLHKRYENLSKLLSGLELLENEILFSKDYIDDIFLRISLMLGTKYIFNTCANKEKDEKMSVRWITAVEEDYKKMHLTNEDAQALKLLANELGGCDTKAQIKNIIHIKTLIERQRENSLEEYKKNSKLYRGLGVASGLFAVIILL